MFGFPEVEPEDDCTEGFELREHAEYLAEVGLRALFRICQVEEEGARLVFGDGWQHCA